MVHVEQLIAYPLKSMDGVGRDRARLVSGGALAGDRSYALFEADADPETASVGGGGGYVNGKSEHRVHELRAEYDIPEVADATPDRVRLDAPEREARSFTLPDMDGSLEAWLTEYFGYPVTLARDENGGFPDDTTASGPTIISQATLEEVGSWFDDSGIDAADLCRRLRPNVVLSDCPAFWEDRLFADRDSRVRFRIGDVQMEGVNPCQRCVVPTRHPDTGEPTPGFRDTFIEQRRATMPEWSGGDWFDHHFRLMVNTDVPEAEWGAEIGVGDDVTLDGTVSASEER